MALALMNIEEQISLISLNGQIAMKAYLADLIKQNSETSKKDTSFIDAMQRCLSHEAVEAIRETQHFKFTEA